MNFCSELKMSEEVDEIIPALIKAAHQVQVVGKNAPNQTWKYANLETVRAAANEALQPNGLAISCFPANHGSRYGVVAMVMHESGQWMRCMVVLPTESQEGRHQNQDQLAGGSFTYIRRYCICAILNIVTGEDVDANTPEQQEVTVFIQKVKKLQEEVGLRELGMRRLLETMNYKKLDKVPAEEREKVLTAIKEINRATS